MTNYELYIYTVSSNENEGDGIRLVKRQMNTWSLLFFVTLHLQIKFIIYTLHLSKWESSS